MVEMLYKCGKPMDNAEGYFSRGDEWQERDKRCREGMFCGRTELIDAQTEETWAWLCDSCWTRMAVEKGWVW